MVFKYCKKEDRYSEKPENEKRKLFYPPELLFSTGIPGKLRKDQLFMKNLEKHSVHTPQEKFNLIQEGIDIIKNQLKKS